MTFGKISCQKTCEKGYEYFLTKNLMGNLSAMIPSNFNHLHLMKSYPYDWKDYNLKYSRVMQYEIGMDQELDGMNFSDTKYRVMKSIQRKPRMNFTCVYTTLCCNSLSEYIHKYCHLTE